MNYVEQARHRLAGELAPSVPDTELVDLYTLLVLVKGGAVTLEDVHDAWAVWTSQRWPGHRSLIPFDQLSQEVQGLDRRYAEAIAAAAKED